MQNENENSDIIDLLEKNLKASRKKIRTAYMGAATELPVDMPSYCIDASCGNHDQVRGGVLG